MSGSSWSEYTEHALSIQHYTAATLDDRERKLRHLQNHDVTLFPLLDTSAFERYISIRRREGARGCTLNHYIKAVNSLLKSQDRNNEIYTKFPERGRPKRTPTTNEIERLLSTCTRSHRDKRLKTMIYFLAHSGLRVTELCTIKINDIDIENNKITVLGKGEKYRTIPIKQDVLSGERTPSITNYIKYHRNEPNLKKDEIYLWINEQGGPVTPAQFRVQLKQIGKKADAGWIHPHSIRHFYATWLLKLGVRVTVVQIYMGHGSLETTSGYLHELEADMANIMEKINMDDLLRRGGNL